APADPAPTPVPATRPARGTSPRRRRETRSEIALITPPVQVWPDLSRNPLQDKLPTPKNTNSQGARLSSLGVGSRKSILGVSFTDPRFGCSVEPSGRRCRTFPPR